MTDIALYVPSLRGGGAERVMLALANGLAARGKRVDLVLASVAGPYLPDVSERVRIIDLKSNGVAGSLPALIRYLRREQPKSVLSAVSHANVIAIIANEVARTRTRLVVSEHNTMSASVRNDTSLRQRVVWTLMRWLYRKADAIVAVSNGVADDLATAIGMQRRNIEVIYNPVVTLGLEARASEPLDHPWFGEGQPPVLLAVGRLNAQKDFDTLLRAVSKVRAKRDCRLVILGEGELRQRLQETIAELGMHDSVLMPGFADNPFQWMRQASLFVLSSAWEGLPTVLIEAMACGTAVVSTDCPSGPREILEGGKWGALVPVGDVEGLADQIGMSLDAAVVPDVAARGRHFSVDRAVDEYIRCLLPARRS